MPKLPPVRGETLARVLELEGFVRQRIRRSHLSMTKPGLKRPVVIKLNAELGPDLLLNNLRTANMSRDRFLELLKQV